MYRSTLVRTLAVASSVTVATALGGTAVAMSPDGTATVVVNKNGHEVNPHAAKGQARAAEARAQRADDDAEEPVLPTGASDEDDAELTDEVTEDAGTHGQAGEDHGRAGDDHGQAAADHGQQDGHGDEAQGQDGDDHGQAGADHGHAGEHGNPGGEDAAPGAND